MATPTTTLHAPGPGNVYIPTYGKNHGATGKLQVEFSRNPSTFAFNQYVQVVPDCSPKGLYLELDTDEAVRVVNLQDFEWPDGNDAPDGEGRKLKWLKYATNRRAFPFKLGSLTVDVSDFEIVAANARMSATQAMTARAYDAIDTLLTAATWPTGSKAATVDALIGTTSGSSWVTSGTTDLFIEQSFHTVVEAIVKNTAGAVRPSEIMCVMGPTTAHRIRRTAEIKAYLVNHESAIPGWEQTGIFTTYGLPPQMFGVNIVVEDAVRVETRHGAATTTKSFMMGDEVFFCSRPGGLTGGVEGAPTFSTVTAFVHEDMTTETLTDPWNRNIKGRVVDNLDVVITAPISGYHINDITT